MASEAIKKAYPFYFITGGCRSGKSDYAQRLTEHLSSRYLFIATAQAGDPEMLERIRLHQNGRGSGWRTYEVKCCEAPSLWKTLPDICREGEAVLLDCLTLWASGCMEKDRAPVNFDIMCGTLMDSLQKIPCPVVIVHNEVGMGVVPSSPSGRSFRDMAGTAGQTGAAAAHTAILVVCGLPVLLKGELPSL